MTTSALVSRATLFGSVWLLLAPQPCPAADFNGDGVADLVIGASDTKFEDPVA